MRIIRISDDAKNKDKVEYVRSTLERALSETGGSARNFVDGDRVFLEIRAVGAYADYARGEAEDKISDAIAVGYKYDFFKSRIKAVGLNRLESEILYSALIAADIDEDKRYVSRRIRSLDRYAIDGVYNFRLAPLKKKWEEISEYAPSLFTTRQLVDFVRYLVGEKKGKKAIVSDGKVYDGNYNLLERVNLLPNEAEGRILREVILSASGKVEVNSELPEFDKKYLCAFYGDKLKTVAR